MELEMLDGVAEMFAAAEAEGAASISEGALVQESEAVAQFAEGPAIADNSPSTLSKVKDFINTNPYAKNLWSLVKFGASASAAFGVMYGLNLAVAKKAHETGKRQPLTEYLANLKYQYDNVLLVPWTQDLKVLAATAALSFPWIDATQ